MDIAHFKILTTGSYSLSSTEHLNFSLIVFIIAIQRSRSLHLYLSLLMFDMFEIKSLQIAANGSDYKVYSLISYLYTLTLVKNILYYNTYMYWYSTFVFIICIFDTE